MSKRVLRGMRAIVTGASSGIGRELALELARKGCSVCASARRENLLAELTAELNAIRESVAPESPEHFYIVGDVCSDTLREAAVSKTIERLGGLDLLVNNAGAGATLPIEETSDELACEIFDLNFFSPMELTKLSLPALRESARQGRSPLVINLSSIVGFRGTPYYGVYGSAKSALLTLTDAWRTELSGVGIDFLTVMPGTTASQFFDVLREDECRPALPKHKPASSKDVALAIVKAAEQRKRRIVPVSRAANLLYLVGRFCPSLCDSIMRRASFVMSVKK